MAIIDDPFRMACRPARVEPVGLVAGVGDRRRIAARGFGPQGRLVDIAGEAAIAVLDVAAGPALPRQPQLEADARRRHRPRHGADPAGSLIGRDLLDRDAGDSRLRQRGAGRVRGGKGRAEQRGEKDQAACSSQANLNGLLVGSTPASIMPWPRELCFSFRGTSSGSRIWISRVVRGSDETLRPEPWTKR